MDFRQRNFLYCASSSTEVCSEESNWQSVNIGPSNVPFPQTTMTDFIDADFPHQALMI